MFNKEAIKNILLAVAIGFGIVLLAGHAVDNWGVSDVVAGVGGLILGSIIFIGGYYWTQSK